MRPVTRNSSSRLSVLAAPGLMLLAVVSLAGCGGGSSSVGAGSSDGTISAVAAENEYANVLEQIGGRYVRVTAIESSPSTDPHAYEASPSTAQAVAGAKMLIENGAGYDTFMAKIESASPDPSRKVINVQKLLGLPESTSNPHLWYKPATMPLLATAIVSDISSLQPEHAAYFRAHARAFEASLRPWLKALAVFASRYPRATVATTEPVADYMLEAAGMKNLTPFSMQADVMNGTDPAPQAVSLQDSLLSGHKVKVLVHNRQVSSPITEAFVAEAKRQGIPVVGVYETMPTPGYDYQSWMRAEVEALERALAEHVSTETL